MRTITAHSTITRSQRRAIMSQSVLMCMMLGVIILSLIVPINTKTKPSMPLHRATPAEIQQRQRDRLSEALKLEAERRERLLAEIVENCQIRMGGRYQRPC